MSAGNVAKLAVRSWEAVGQPAISESVGRMHDGLTIEADVEFRTLLLELCQATFETAFRLGYLASQQGEES